MERPKPNTTVDLWPGVLRIVRLWPAPLSGEAKIAYQLLYEQAIAAGSWSIQVRNIDVAAFLGRVDARSGTRSLEQLQKEKLITRSAGSKGSVWDITVEDPAEASIAWRALPPDPQRELFDPHADGATSAGDANGERRPHDAAREREDRDGPHEPAATIPFQPRGTDAATFTDDLAIGRSSEAAGGCGTTSAGGVSGTAATSAGAASADLVPHPPASRNFRASGRETSFSTSVTSEDPISQTGTEARRVQAHATATSAEPHPPAATATSNRSPNFVPAKRPTEPAPLGGVFAQLAEQHDRQLTDALVVRTQTEPSQREIDATIDAYMQRVGDPKLFITPVKRFALGVLRGYVPAKAVESLFRNLDNARRWGKLRERPSQYFNVAARKIFRDYDLDWETSRPRKPK